MTHLATCKIYHFAPINGSSALPTYCCSHPIQQSRQQKISVSTTTEQSRAEHKYASFRAQSLEPSSFQVSLQHVSTHLVPHWAPSLPWREVSPVCRHCTTEVLVAYTCRQIETILGEELVRKATAAAANFFLRIRVGSCLYLALECWLLSFGLLLLVLVEKNSGVNPGKSCGKGPSSW